ncbi:hypothetical protein [Stackebrandtia soli]|uniref:hypothetical protein n=1 Tax=Stackebrandtia soli TaxID=1892856 RepID=UPI0039EA1F33
MDRFSSTLLSAASEAGIATITLSRHVPNLRRNVRSDESVVLLAHCVLPDGRLSGDHLMLLTGSRLVVTRQSKVLGRVRADIDIELSELGEVRWNADPTLPGVELAFTALGRWYRYWIDTRNDKQLWRLDAKLGTLFRKRRRTVAVA